LETYPPGPLPFKERSTGGESKRGEASLVTFFPLPYQGRGIKGEGYLINIKGVRFSS